MNENLDLVEILKDCPKGTKLYSPIFGEVEFEEVNDDNPNPIVVKVGLNLAEDEEDIIDFTSIGTWDYCFDGECLLFPSKEQRDWSKFKPKKAKFDPNTLNPFDMVLARNDREDWNCMFFSHIVKDEDTYPYACGYDMFTYCIPYNEDTKHLVGKFDEAPEFYRYWED